MGQHKLTGTGVRTAIANAMAALGERIGGMRSAAGFKPVASKPRFSTRGERKQTWRTKAHTKVRRQDRDSDLEATRKAAAKRDGAQHSERTEERRNRGPRYTNGGRQRPYCNV